MIRERALSVKRSGNSGKRAICAATELLLLSLSVVVMHCRNPVSTPPQPAITSHPRDTSVVPGSTVMFTVSAQGIDLAYQWERDGVPIPAATQSSYTVASVDTGLSGSLIRCRVSNLGGAVTSTEARLNVAIPGTGLTILTPTGWEDYRVGDTMVITWEYEARRLLLKINFSADNNLTRTEIGSIFMGSPELGRGPFRWVVPESIFAFDKGSISTVSDSCVIDIHEYVVNGYHDQTDRLIRIRPR